MFVLPQFLRWARNDGFPAGALISTSLAHVVDPQPQQFVDWENLEPEFVSLVRPQLFENPTDWVFQLQNLGEKEDWLLRLVNIRGGSSFDVWVGVNPDRAWIWDGLLHIGKLAAEPEKVFQSFQRYSDRSYRRAFALVNPLDRPTNVGVRHYGFDLRPAATG